MSTATTTINYNTLGIQEISTEVAKGNLTVDQAFAIVQGRIAKRTTEKKSQLTKVVEYRNQLATTLRGMQVGMVDSFTTDDMPLPKYTAQAVAPMSVDPKHLADQVFATVGAENVVAVITQLTARVVGSSTSK